MLDIVFVVLTLLFFIVAAAYVSAASGSSEARMTTELFVGLLAAVGLLAYLLVALLRPERF